MGLFWYGHGWQEKTMLNAKNKMQLINFHSKCLTVIMIFACNKNNKNRNAALHICPYQVGREMQYQTNFMLFFLAQTFCLCMNISLKMSYLHHQDIDLESVFISETSNVNNLMSNYKLCKQSFFSMTHVSNLTDFIFILAYIVGL